MGRRKQKMHMVGHEYPAMDRYHLFRRTFFKPVRISRCVFVGGKQRLAVVSALDDLHRIVRRAKSRVSWHHVRLLINRL